MEGILQPKTCVCVPQIFGILISKWNAAMRAIKRQDEFNNKMFNEVKNVISAQQK